jgi:hypothetical protein
MFALPHHVLRRASLGIYLSPLAYFSSQNLLTSPHECTPNMTAEAALPILARYWEQFSKDGVQQTQLSARKQYLVRSSTMRG